MRGKILGLLLLAFATAGVSIGQPPEQEELPAEAKRRLESILGTWDSTWNWLDAEGAVVRTLEGIEAATWAIEGRVVLLSTEIPSLGNKSSSFMYYSETEQLFHLTSVDSRGDLWLLAGGLDEYVITSEPKPRPDGGEMIIRFTHHEADRDHFSAVMETSLDGGKTWRKAVHQELVRRP